ncbi:MAG: class IV adenylate cyclase [Acidobacteriota bacterium]
MVTANDREIEVKIAIRDLAGAAAALRRAGFEKVGRCVHERNQLYDFPDGRLRKAGCALRLRTVGKETVLTFKGKKKIVAGMKVREELETGIADPRTMMLILRRAGLEPAFFYEKLRTTFAKSRLTAVIDHTPIGDFLELEGEPAAIDAEIPALGYSRRDFIKESYVELFRKAHTGDMVFGEGGVDPREGPPARSKKAQRRRLTAPAGRPPNPALRTRTQVPPPPRSGRPKNG